MAAKERNTGYVKVNEHGRRIGESHPRAKLTDHEVGLVLALLADGLSQRQIAARMDVTRHTIARIYQRKVRAELHR